ncbi:polysaccharide deacetylase family protein [Nocardiopsis chromatogenes]|uniref:polysaccharide deacetylase family protein n=1 Tax=Nocardiopsis chromatogenes TaxID=280239 RepID=UPI0003450294|nr:polysaccharide deacetylase family protein [Nocardiopsis chromatogenes]
MAPPSFPVPLPPRTPRTPGRIRVLASSACLMLAATGLTVGPAAANASASPAPAASSASAAVDCDAVPCVALTYDDGPGPYTDELLDTLAAEEVRATFFVVGENAQSSPEPVARTASEGHEVGNHSWAHDDLTEKTGPEVARDLERASLAITGATGSWPDLMRPPYGAVSETSLAHTYYPAILWDVDSRDWTGLDSDEIVDSTMSQVSPGSIVLMHDSIAPTVEAAPELIRRLRDEGYHFVTVSEILDNTALEDGTPYRRRP